MSTKFRASDVYSARLRNRNIGQPVEIHTTCFNLLCWHTESWCPNLQVSKSHHALFESYVVSQILLKWSSWGRMCEEGNFRTEHDENINLHFWAPTFNSPKVPIIDVWLGRKHSHILSLLSPESSPDCFRIERTQYKVRVSQNHLHFTTPTLSDPSGWQEAKKRFKARFE